MCPTLFFRRGAALAKTPRGASRGNHTTGKQDQELDETKSKAMTNSGVSLSCSCVSVIRYLALLVLFDIEIDWRTLTLAD